jgi:hypothetical protein
MSRNKVAVKKMRLFTGSTLVAAASLALAPAGARAENSISLPFQGALAVAATINPNAAGTTITCPAPASPGPPETSNLEFVVEAHGSGSTSLGAFSFALNKFVSIPGAMHGCATLTAVNGDTLVATYEGNCGAPSITDYFAPCVGMLTITGGTGGFQGAGGTLNFSLEYLAQYPGNPFTGGPPKPLLYISAFYILEGNVLLKGN